MVSRIGVLGTGTVGRGLAARWASLGHPVRVGSRTGGDDVGTFDDVAAWADVLVNATRGLASVGVIQSIGAEHVDGKTMIDVANPYDLTVSPPEMVVTRGDSLGEQIQRAAPTAHVVKALNTVPVALMVDPGRLRAAHHVFVAGDDVDARRQVRRLIVELGWPEEHVLDLGPLSAARGLEAYNLLAISIHRVVGGLFNVGLVTQNPARSGTPT